MTITEKDIQTAVNFGGAALALSVVLNIYFVMRNREVYRDQLQSEVRFQQLMVQEQALEGVAREFVSRAGSDPKLAEILQRYQIIGNTSQQPAQVKP
jgi:3'-phosphoadenosine 5'-phosphosulfate (PAPS) 3'-phosphatase